MESARSGRLARRLLAVLLGLALAPLVLEGLARGWLAARGAAYDRAGAEARFAALLDRVRGVEFLPPEAPGADPALARAERRNLSLHPYVGFQVQGVWKRGDAQWDYWRSAEADANFDVLLLGGSVAAGFANCCEPELFPLLRADPRLAGRKLALHWRACPGHKQPQHATSLQWALSLGDRPDLVLLLDGFNELAVAAHNAEHGVHPQFPMWAEVQAALESPLSSPVERELAVGIAVLRRDAEELAAAVARTGRLRSAVLGTADLRRLRGLAAEVDRRFARLGELAAQRLAERPPFVAGPAFANEPERVRALSVEAWAQGSRTMHAACRARGIAFLHVLQPAARDLGAKPLTDEEERASREPEVWRAAIEHGYPALREAGAELAREGVAFVDASRVFADRTERIFTDPCHFEQDGYRILARAIAPRILALLAE